MKLFKSADERWRERQAKGVYSDRVAAERAPHVIEEAVSRGWELVSNTYSGIDAWDVNLKQPKVVLVFRYPTPATPARSTER
jgi:hypothetical protein